jgi:hypothetical protein
MAVKDKDLNSPVSLLFLLSSLNGPKRQAVGKNRLIQQPRNNNYRARPGVSNAKPNDRCYNCGEAGHWGRDCPKPSQANKTKLSGWE